MSDPTIAQIQRAVCEWFDISLMEMRSHRQSERLVLPRHVAIYLAVKLTPHSFVVIGDRFNRDRFSIPYASKRIEKLLKTQRWLAFMVDRMRCDLVLRAHGVTHIPQGVNPSALASNRSYCDSSDIAI